MNVHIRPEQTNDQAAIYNVVHLAFENRQEAKLVDKLRQKAKPIISLVAAADETIVAHILFSPVVLLEHPNLKIMGLAPVAVLPQHQSQGIGSALIVDGLIHCKQLGYGAVVVLGHPNYYPRFGFEPSIHFGIRSQYDVPTNTFMAQELLPGYLDGINGTIEYHSAFQDFE